MLPQKAETIGRHRRCERRLERRCQSLVVHRSRKRDDAGGRNELRVLVALLGKEETPIERVFELIGQSHDNELAQRLVTDAAGARPRAYILRVPGQMFVSLDK